MATTPLRIYLHDIEGMVGAGQMEEAVAHCRHILQTFPKSIAVYRLLGKAYLENQRYSDAADVFQRVLSAVPDDFVSHVGLSIIREDEGNMDASIWHMERAFETQPYNSAIQDELRRLYGRRDGMEPPKMRLTRGALARLYMRGDLYQQAIGELRAALAEDPQRPDLQALLARVYYMAGQRVEAVETCSTVLKKLPYCLDANILLGAILPETERAADAQNYRQRAISLEPYFSQAPSSAQTADNVPTNAVTIEKLIYTPGKAGAAEAGQPAWATSLGVAFTDQKEGEAIPDWLSASADTSLAPEEGSTKGSVSPFSEAEAPSVFPWEASSKETNTSEEADAEPAATEAIPDWMKDAGWISATGEAKEEPVSFDIKEEAAAPVEGELAPADIPDWLREAAPPGVLEHPNAPAEEKSTEDVLPWLQETPPGPTDTIVSWLSATKSDVPTSTEESQPVPPVDLLQQPGTETGSITDLGGFAEAEETEIPDWLKENASSQKTESTAEAAQASELPDWIQPGEPAGQVVAENELPDWLQGSEAETTAVSTDLPEWLKTESPGESISPETTEQLAASMEEVPDWLKAGPEEVESPAPPTVPIEATPGEEAPDWLKAGPEEVETPAPPTIPAEATPDEAIPEVMPVEAAPAETVQDEATVEEVHKVEAVETTAPAEEFPSWLKEVEAEIPDEAVETPQLKGVTEWLETVNTGDLATGPVGITDWLSKVESGQETTPAEPGPSAVDIFPWLRETKDEGTGETPPAQELSPAVPAEELPDWMREIEAGLPVAEAAEEHGISAVEIQKAAEAEVEGAGGLGELPETIPPTGEAIPSEITPAFERDIPAGLNLEDQDASLAWLEGLAAKQGVPEEELISKPEERAEIASSTEVAPAAPAEEIPEWMKEIETEEVTSIAEVVPTQAVPAEEVPDWLKVAEAAGVEADVPEELAPVIEAVPTEAPPTAEGGLPAGLDLTDQDAALAWLEGLAAKQGVPEEELISKPEERAEITPSAEVVPAAPAEDIPEWMKEIETEEVTSITEVVRTEAAPAEEVPDWLKAIEAEVPEEAAPVAETIPPEAALAEEVPDWLKAAEAAGVKAEVPGEVAPVIEAVPTEAPPAAESGLPAGLDLTDQDAALAWLEGLAAKQGVPEEELISKPEERTEITPSAEVIPAAPAEEIPEWLKEIETEEVTSIAEAVPTEAAPTEEVPDWLKAAEAAGVEVEVPEELAPVVEAVPTEALPAAEGGLPAGLDLTDQDAALAWLEGLAAKQGVPEEELISKPEERTGIAPSTEFVPAAPAEEIPEWMKEIETEEVTTIAEVVPTEAAPTEEVPDWLKAAEAAGVEAEVPEEAAPLAEVVPTEAAPAAEGGLPAGLDLTDQDAALAWLEGLAAKQGVLEEELISKPEERAEIAPSTEVAPAAPAEEIPEWMKEIETEEVTIIAEVVPTEAAPGEEVPDWLKAAEAAGVEAEVPEEAAPLAKAVPSEAAHAAEGGLPAGLDLTDQDAALAWLEGLAAKQGVPEEELISKPEERAGIAPSNEVAPAAPAEEIPEWLKAATAEIQEETAAEEQEEKPVTTASELHTLAAVAEVEAPPAEAAPVEISSQPTEWIKETELSEWLEKTELAKPSEKGESETELPGWITEATSQETEIAWEPPKILDHAATEKADEHKRTNLNSASVGELERLPGIGFVLAQSIINHRSARGPFTRMEDLLDVPGIGPGIIEVLKNWISIQPVKEQIIEESGPPLDPDHIILRQAHNALDQGDIPTAVKEYERLLDRMVLLNEIILDLQDALYRYPVDISIWQALGDAYMRNNQLQDALDAYTKAEELLR